jgi:type IV pilus assembly protein PilN
MIRVNLLPHREEKRKRRQQQFMVLAGIAGVLGLLVAGGVYAFLDSQVSQQQANVAYMNNEIAKLDKEIEEIRKIREETAALLAKKQVVENLQANRSEPVQLLDQLLRQLPDGVYLKAIKQTGAKVNITGYAQSNARVSTLMRNLGASPYLENPELVEIKAVTAPDKSRVNEFNMNISIKRAQPEGAAAGKGAPAKGGAAAKPAGAK